MERGVDNRYTILGELGSGGAGKVFLARDEVLGREVALKMLDIQRKVDAGLVRRFEREARSTASLSHPNVVAVHDLGELSEGDASGGRGLYIVMEYVPGINLADLIRERGPLPPATAVSIALSAARGLGAAHAKDIVHRDVKPANILLSNPSGESLYSAGSSDPEVVKVTDFGISRRLSDDTLTEQNAIMGTTHYLSPEQALGGNVDLRSDLYSLGVVLYEMLTGKRPFEAREGDSPLAVAMRHVTEDPEPLSDAIPGIPSALGNLTLGLLGKEPEERPGSASELAMALEGILEDAMDPEPRPGLGAPEAAYGGQSMESRSPGDNGRATEASPARDPKPPGDSSTEPSAGIAAEHPGRRRMIRYALPALLASMLLALAVGVLSGVGTPRLTFGAGGAGGTGSADSTSDAGNTAVTDDYVQRSGVEIPGIEGKSLAEARRLVGDEVEIEVASRKTNQASPGTILAAKPGPGREVQPGSVIELVVSEGPSDGDATQEISRAVDEYYAAVKRWDWSYTYDHLDARSQEMFSRAEWYRKNQHLAENAGLRLDSREIELLSISDSGDYAEVNVYRTYESGHTIDRNTVFVYEVGEWKHRLVGEELVFFMPDASFEEFRESY